MGAKSVVAPLLAELKERIKASGLKQRKVEDRAGFSQGYLSQLLGGHVELKVWHLLAILDALDLAPGELFDQIYPRQPEAARKAPRQAAPRRSALAEFAERSEPLSEDIDRTLGRLYDYGIESLDDLRGRLERCERAVGQLERTGLLGAPRRSRSQR